MSSPHLARRVIAAPLLCIGFAGAALAAPAAAAPSITPSSAYVNAGIAEIPTAVAVSNTGVIAASLYDAQAVALVDPDGTVRQAALECSPADVAISPGGETAWAVCQEDVHLHVVEVASLVVSVASMDVDGLDSLVYLPAVDELIIGSLEGAVIVVGEVVAGQYSKRVPVYLPKDGPHRVTEVAPLSDGSGAYAITDSGDLLYVDLDFGGQSVIIARSSAERSFQSIALGPFDTALYATVVDYSSSTTVTTVGIVDMETGKVRQSVPLDVAGGVYAPLDIAASYRAVHVSVGSPVATPTGSTGLLTLPVNGKGRITDVQSAPVPSASGAGVAVSADSARVAFGTLDPSAVGEFVDDGPYPAAIRIGAKAKGSKVTVTGSTTSMRPLTELAVYIKDLTKRKATFKKQSQRAFVNYQGDIRWKGKAPSTRFAVYVAGAGAKSATVTVKRR